MSISNATIYILSEHALTLIPNTINTLTTQDSNLIFLPANNDETGTVSP